MQAFQQIYSGISYLPAIDEPLSADVVVIKGKEFCWLFDVGMGENALAAIGYLPGMKKAVISHFHPDHCGNLSRLGLDEIFVGKNTYKYTGIGTIVEQNMFLEDGRQLRIFPMASSHAKGSLALDVDEKYLFVGDAFCPQFKNGQRLYNTTILHSQLELLENIKADNIGISHQADFIMPKSLVLEKLKKLYGKRGKNQAYIVETAFDW